MGLESCIADSSKDRIIEKTQTVIIILIGYSSDP